jgi:hypothetical protein
MERLVRKLEVQLRALLINNNFELARLTELV